MRLSGRFCAVFMAHVFFPDQEQIHSFKLMETDQRVFPLFWFAENQTMNVVFCQILEMASV